MEKPRQGLLHGLPFNERAWIECEVDDAFADVDDSMDELRVSLHDLRRLLDRTFHGVQE